MTRIHADLLADIRVRHARGRLSAVDRHLLSQLERAARTRNHAEAVELGHDRGGTGAGTAGKPAASHGEHLVGGSEIPLGALHAMRIVRLNALVDGPVHDRQSRVGEGSGCADRLHEERHTRASEGHLGNLGCRLEKLRRDRDRGTAAHSKEVGVAIALGRNHVENGARNPQLSSQRAEIESIHQGETISAILSDSIGLVADVGHEACNVVQVEMRPRATRATTPMHNAQLDREDLLKQLCAHASVHQNDRLRSPAVLSEVCRSRHGSRHEVRRGAAADAPGVDTCPRSSRHP